MASKSDRIVNQTVKLQPYVSLQAKRDLQKLLRIGRYGNSLNAVAARMIEERLNLLADERPLKKKK